MSYGMSYDQYWNGDNEMPRMYKQAYLYRIEHENQMAWLQGLYIYDAIGALAPVLKAFSKGRAQKYAKEPYELNLIKTKPAKKKKEEKSTQTAIAYLTAWADNVNKKMEEKQRKEGHHAYPDSRDRV